MNSINSVKHFFVIAFLLFGSVLTSFSQTASTTVSWTGALAQGACSSGSSGLVCGGDWQCSSNSWGGWNSGLKTFTDPVPAGNTITSVTVAVYQTDCSPSSVNITLNGQNLGTYSATGTGCACGGPCLTYSVTQTGPFPGYNYGGVNTVQFNVSGGVLCANRAVLTFNYSSSSVTGPCPNDNVAAGFSTLTPPCGNFDSRTLGGGTYIDFNVVQGASYSFSTCNTSPSFDTKISAYQGGTSTLAFFAEDDGPFCAGERASATWTSSFTGTLRVNIDEATCTYSTTSAILQFRQNNNVSIDSISTVDICVNATRALTAYPPGGIFTVSSGGGSFSGVNYTAPNNAGTYTITYTLGSCSASDDIEVLPAPSDPGNVTAIPNTAICPGASVDLTVNGGTLGTGGEWVWYIGNSCGGSVFQNSGSSRTISVSPSSTTTYSVRAEGDCGNSACVSRTVTVNVLSTDPTSANANPTNVCAGDPTQLTVSGGTLGTGGTYEWYVGGCGSGTSIASGTTVTVNPLIPTTYYVRAEDNCGVTSCVSVSVGIKTESTAPTGIDFTDNNFCPGTTTTLSVLGGSLGTGAQWVWYDGNACCVNQVGTGSSIVVAPNSTTNYYVRAEGDCNNTTHASTTITVLLESTPPTSISENNNPVCGVQSNTVTMNVVGGSLGAGAGWEWYEGSCGGTPAGSGPSITVNNLTTTTTYFVRAEGTCNMTSCAFVTIEVSNGITVDSTSSTNPSCTGGSDGTASVFITGGIPPYSYGWSHTIDDTFSVGGLSAGTYTVTAVDFASCPVIQSFNLVDPPLLSITNVQKTNLLCNGGTTGQIDVFATGGTPPLRYSVDGGSNYQSSGTFTGLSAGPYDVQVLDTNNCLTVFSGNPVVLTEPTLIVVSIDSFKDASCSGSNDGQIFSSATGGNPPYDYSLNGGPFQPAGYFASLSSGNYTVSVRDANGCTETASVFIDNKTALTVYEVSSTDATCFGICDGSATFATINGTSPINYTINNIAFQTSPTFNGLCAGSYTVLAIDALGCSNDTTFTIDEPSEIVITVDSVVNIGCNGSSTGEIYITATGGNGGFSYDWSDGSTDEDRTGLAAGTYAVTVTDVNNCTNTTIVTLTEAPQLFLSLADIDSIDCNGVANGRIDITVGGGTLPYSYSWSNGQTLEDISGLAPGNYTVTVTDANGCILIDSWTVTEPTAINVSALVSDADCNTFTTGAIDASVSGGVAPYSYFWSNGDTTEDLSGIPGGSYILTVVDANGCSKSQAFTVGDPGALTINETVTDVSCYGAADGEVSVSVSGGVGPYTYSWTNGDTTNAISGLSGGVYGLTVTDDNGCNTFASFVVAEPDSLVPTAVVSLPNCAGDSSATVDLTVNGGTAPFTYSWSNGETTQDLSGLLGGTFTVTVTDDNSCTATGTFTVNPVDSMQLIADVEDVTCNGKSDGRIFVTVVYGQPPYLYTWNGGQNTSDLTGLSTGTYSLTVTDALGCTVADTFNVGEPAVLSVLATGNDAACNGQASGSVNLNVSGGTSPYSYQWSNLDTSQNLNNVAAGNYSVVVTDDNNCTATTSYTVGEPTAISVDDSITNVSCNGASDGAIDLTVTGGTGPYTFNWSNGDTTEDISNLTAGIYDVVVMDNNSCSDTLSYTLVDPTLLSATSVVTDVTCNGASDGAVDVTVSGGTMPYTYSWDSGDSTQDLSGKVAGVYELTITDGNGCTFVLADTINEPDMIVLTDTVTDVSCNGGFDGAVDITVTGGQAPYTYVWSIGLVSQDISGLYAGSYEVTVTDNNGCQVVGSYVVGQPQVLSASFTGNDAFCFGDSTGSVDLTVNGGTAPFTYTWNTGDTTEDLSNVPAGLYTVGIEDANGCYIFASFAVNQPPALSVSGAITNATCFGSADGAVDITVSGGTPSYSFDWDNFAITEDITGVTGGIYQVVVTDANGCTDTSSYQVGQPDSFNVNAQVIDVDCYGSSTGGVDISVSGANPPYVYNWSTGDTTQDVFGLVAGVYTLTLSDLNSCGDTLSYTVNEPDSLETEITSVNLACNGTPTGSVDLTVIGGTPPYRYSWSSGQTTQDLNNISAGFYSVTVTDFNGCTKFDSVTVTQPDLLSASANISNVLCNGDSTGSIDLTPLGGTPPYTFGWSNGEITEDISNLVAGLYSVTITDDSSCTRVLTYNVSEPAPLGTDLISQRNILCYGQNSGSVVLAATGGVQPYSFNWSNGDTTNIIDRLTAGDYYLTLTDGNGCEALDTFTILQPDSILITSVLTNATCNGGFDGGIDITVSGGVGPYTYFWNDFVFSEDRSNLAAGRYVVIVEDSNGCTAVDSSFVGQPTPIVIDVFVKGAGCGAATGGIIDLTVSGGTPGYTYLWSTGDTTEDLTQLAAGSYTVTVSDTNNCEETRTIVIPSYPEPETRFIATNVCFGETIQFINNSQISSGTLDYYWDYGNGDVDSLIENPFYTYPDSGTYSVVLTAISNNGCAKSDTQTVTVYPLPDATILGTGGSPCVIDSVELSVVGGHVSYAWSTGDTSTTTFAYQSGVYGVSVINSFGCLNKDTVTVYISEVNNVSISEDTVVNFGFGAQLYAIGGSEYIWSPAATIDNPFSAMPIVTPETSTTYSVVVSDENGCTYTDSVFVEVDDEILLIIPNIITPNGDGFNDTWKIKNILNYDICQVNIYNRWGNEVYSQKGYNNDWDGGKLSDGTYYYVIKCDDSDVLYKGAVTILR